MLAALSGAEIELQHCAIESKDDRLRLVVDQGKCFLNRTEILEDAHLSHGKHMRSLTMASGCLQRFMSD